MASRDQSYSKETYTTQALFHLQIEPLCFAPPFPRSQTAVPLLISSHKCVARDWIHCRWVYYTSVMEQPVCLQRRGRAVSFIQRGHGQCVNKHEREDCPSNDGVPKHQPRGRETGRLESKANGFLGDGLQEGVTIFVRPLSTTAAACVHGCSHAPQMMFSLTIIPTGDQVPRNFTEHKVCRGSKSATSLAESVCSNSTDWRCMEP